MLTHSSKHLEYFSLIKAARKLDRSGCTAKLKVAVLADFATQQLAQLLDVLFVQAGIDATLHVADYGVMDQEVLDPKSELYALKPDVVFVLQCTQALRERHASIDGDRSSLGDLVARECQQRWEMLRKHCGATIVQSLFALPTERPFGNYDRLVPESLTATTLRANARLTEAARESNTLLLDVEALASWIGRKSFFDEKLWALGKTPCALEQLPWLAQGCVDIAATLRGRVVKCVILDLDNTLWGGVIGDDGVDGIALGHAGDGEPFHRFQLYLRELKRRGIVLAVCSKNEEDAARKPFREHPEMVLREEDIAVFVANWNTKVDNIKTIREVLNLGFDSMVFVDDNPFERNMVREYLPQVTVPELPEDPADYVRALSELNLFETSAYTDEDRDRSRQYREESNRKLHEKAFTDVDGYLQSLAMKIAIRPFDTPNLPRIAQLIQRSNQFNLTTRRYGLPECEALMNDASVVPLYVRLADRFGDYGLISVVALRKEQEVRRLRIDSWLMSCRVLARGVEQHVMNHAVSVARSLGVERLVGEYVPTSKNKMVKDFYGRFGFEKTQEAPDGHATWELDVSRYTPGKTWLDEETTS
jgi:FkbH-like protein